MSRDPHSERALDLFGEVTPDTRSRAKIINYAESYGAGQISLSRRAGQYPMERTKP
jgi:DNA polymerase I-like protein with 3'-5' exonuclease and polymerase domains